jgi:hypothetical protein
MKKKEPTPKATSPAYKPSPREESAIRKWYARSADGSGPRLKVRDEDGVPKTSLDHPVEVVGELLLMEALGTTDSDFLTGLISQLSAACSDGGQIDEARLNFMLSIVKGITPRDQTEAMLAAQMAAIHALMMAFAGQLARVENIPELDSTERALNKLARTFVTQVEALKRYRTGGEQKVTVQHVSVQEGGQAIVGNVTQASRQTTADRPPVSPPALTHSKEAPMPIPSEPARAAVGARRKVKK